MPDLSACYFCGAAADAQVREYDVVPDAADESLRSTATLCPGCREKLETVLSPVVRGARPSDEPVDVRLEAIEAGGADAAASTPTLEVESEDILAAADRSRDAADDEAAAADAEDSDAANADAASGGTGPASGVENGSATDAGAASSGADEGTASDDETDADDADPLAGPDADSPTDGIAFGDDADASASSSADAETESESTGDDGPTAGGSDAATASSGGSADDVDRPDADTYNRVVRLLQNREFPVNRSEFSELASSAYDIPADECANVIDYAIKRGELVEDSGMLKKP
ncbi:hypothetical protein [Natronoarchaeum mannanilyticum]